MKRQCPDALVDVLSVLRTHNFELSCSLVSNLTHRSLLFWRTTTMADESNSITYSLVPFQEANSTGRFKELSPAAVGFIALKIGELSNRKGTWTMKFILKAGHCCSGNDFNLLNEICQMTFGNLPLPTLDDGVPFNDKNGHVETTQFTAMDKLISFVISFVHE